MSSEIAFIAIKVVKDVDEKGCSYRALYRAIIAKKAVIVGPFCTPLYIAL
jgi:hypothetical protein